MSHESDLMPVPDADIVEPTRKGKERILLLTVFLWWLAIGNAIAGLMAPFFLASIRKKTIPDFPDWAPWVFTAFSLLNVICVVALFRWKKWGLYGYVLSTLGIFSLNVYAGLSISAAALGFIGTAILLSVLQMGEKRTGWQELE